MKKKMGKQASKQLKRLFFRAAFITLGCVSVMVAATMIVGKSLVKSVQVSTDYEEYTPKQAHGDEGENLRPDDVGNTTVMIFGVDEEEARTDTILIAHFDCATNRISISSVPRDTKVYWTEEQIDKAIELDRLYQYESKITEMSSLGGIENLRYFTIRSVEEMLDIKVDNYVVVNTKVVREMVDKLGGIEFNVPRVMKYDDNWQNLHIDLQPGLQVLNGHQAEGVLRWRHNKEYTEQYAQGDLGRIETQQLFIKAFMDKVINDVSVGKVIDIITTLYTNVKTDMDFNEVINYAKYLPYLSIDNISMKTLPGTSQNEWFNGSEKSYFILDEDELLSFVNEQFYGIIPADKVEETEKAENSTTQETGEA